LPGNANAHEQGTGAEMWEQSGGTVEVFCDFVGTGGTFAGVSRHLKSQDPRIACFVVEPEGAAALAGGVVTDPGHRIQGGGYAMADLDLIGPGLIDGYLAVTDTAAIDAARRLARFEGIFAGFSSGAVVAAAETLLDTTHRGATVGVVLADSGMKYLSTDLW
jgi:cysteine synthase A